MTAFAAAINAGLTGVVSALQKKDHVQLEHFAAMECLALTADV
jgi:nucleoid DNA-binding protein